MATKRPCRKGASVTLRPIGLLLIIMLAAMNCVAAETKSFGTLAETGQGAVEGLAIADLPASGVTSGSYNNVTVNAAGQVTGGSNTSYLTAIGVILNEYPVLRQAMFSRGNSIERELPIPEYLASRHQRTEASRVCVHSRRQQH